MVITPLPRVIADNWAQLENAYSPMVATLLGMLISRRPVQLLNAPLPMLDTLLPRVTADNWAQLTNTLLPMLVTLLGMLIADRLMQL